MTAIFVNQFTGENITVTIDKREKTLSIPFYHIEKKPISSAEIEIFKNVLSISDLNIFVNSLKK